MEGVGEAIRMVNGGGVDAEGVRQTTMQSVLKLCSDVEEAGGLEALLRQSMKVREAAEASGQTVEG
jgi:hypothetical protein